jgi:hypothetical protein
VAIEFIFHYYCLNLHFQRAQKVLAKRIRLANTAKGGVGQLAKMVSWGIHAPKRQRHSS